MAAEYSGVGELENIYRTCCESSKQGDLEGTKDLLLELRDKHLKQKKGRFPDKEQFGKMMHVLDEAFTNYTINMLEKAGKRAESGSVNGVDYIEREIIQKAKEVGRPEGK